MEYKVKVVLASAVLILITIELIYGILPYLNAFLGAFILFVILRPINHLLTNKIRLPKNIAALITIIISFVVILLPLYFLIVTVISELQSALSHVNDIPIYLNSLSSLVNSLHLESTYAFINLNERISQAATSVANYISMVLFGLIQSIGQRAVEFTIMYFLLYYLFINEGTDVANKLYDVIPFNKHNRDELSEEFSNVVKITVISSIIMALIQGGILAISFYLLHIQGPLLWGSMAAIFSFVPVIGAAAIWLPASIIQFLQHEYVAGIGILISGIFISTMDNFIRPYIQKKIGSLHPLISLIGIIVGINLFGPLGLVAGPLLLMYFILIVRMFYEEYVVKTS